MALKLDYVVRETGTNLFRNVSLTIASILTVAVSLALVGSSLMLRSAVDNATQRWEGDIEFIVFMQPDAPQDQTDAVQRQLEAAPQVDTFTYVNQEETFVEFKDLFAKTPQIIDSVTPEILPPSFRVVPTDKSPETVTGLTSKFEVLPGVREAVAPDEAIRIIRSVSNVLGLVLIIIAVCVIVASFLLILNSIRMAMYARRREIEVMKLVGASNWFIRVPFMLEGVVQGLAGSAFAVAVLFGVRRGLDGIAASNDFTLFAGLAVDGQQLSITVVFVVVAGIMLGALGSAFAVSRFLDV